jgi:DedD protein
LSLGAVGCDTLRFFMANQSMTDEELRFRRRARHRLIGAVTLVTGLVVFLPMVLDNEPKPVAEDIAISIPSQDAKPAKIGISLSPKIVPVEQPVPSVPPVGAEPASVKPEVPPVQPLTVMPGGQAPKLAQSSPVEMTKAEQVKSEKPAAAPVETAKPPLPKETVHPAPVAERQEKPKPAAKSEKPAAAPAELIPSPAKEVKQSAPPAKPPVAEKPTVKSAAPPQGGFVVRLGAFAKPENAKQLKAKLASMGVRNYSDILKTASGDKIRVRAGPYAARREAESVRERLKAVDIVGDVVPKP